MAVALQTNGWKWWSRGGRTPVRFILARCIIIHPWWRSTEAIFFSRLNHPRLRGAGEWQTGVFGAPCANPLYCIYASFCNVCVAYQQRQRQMYGSLLGYTCCNGGSCISGRLGEEKCPEACLCLEVWCCFPSAVATTRFMIQDEQRVANTDCDNCLIGFMILMQQLACVFRCAAVITQNDTVEELADILDCVADVSYCSVCACMQTQQHEQLTFRDKNHTPGSHVPTNPPGVMQMTHAQYEQQPYPPPPPSYAQQAPYPQPAYGQPSYGQPTGVARPPPTYTTQSRY